MNAKTWGAVVVVLLTLTGVAISGVAKSSSRLGHLDARLVLLAGAFALFCIARNPRGWASAFAKSMSDKTFINVILPVFAFVAVCRETGTMDAFVGIIATVSAELGLAAGAFALPLLVLVVVLVTFFTNAALVSALATASALAPVFVALLLHAGASPGLAGGAVLAGTWGAVLNPSSNHAALIGKSAGRSEMDVVDGHLRAALLGAVVIAILLAGSAFASSNVLTDPHVPGHVDLRGIVILLPLPMLLVSNRRMRKRNAALKATWDCNEANRGREFTPPARTLVLETMVVGIVVVVAASVASSPTLSLDLDIPRDRMFEHHWGIADVVFSDGFGRGYGRVISIVIAASVFAQGLHEVGLLQDLTRQMLRNYSAATIGTLGLNMVFAASSGSGDAAAFSFNKIAAEDKHPGGGERRVLLARLAWIGAEMGRCVSPVAAATLIVCREAGCRPSEIAFTIIPAVLAGAAIVTVVLWRDAVAIDAAAPARGEAIVR